MTKYVIAFCAALLLVGCGTPQQPQAKAPTGDTTTPAVVEVSFSKDVQPILTASCMPCHSGAADAKSKYVLAGYDGTIGPGKDSVANVLAGNADSSLVFQMLSTGKMPPSGKLDSAKLATIQKWVNEGAKNN